MTPASRTLLQPHFEDLEKQAHAARFGMWVFLATEVLLFGGLFVGYIVYRSLYHRAFTEASHHLDAFLGTIETIVLLTSSLFAVLTIYYLRRRARALCVLFLLLTALMGVAFLALHGLEYFHEFGEGILPGSHYRFSEMPLAGADLFFTLYFCMTGLHGAHVTVGVLVLCWMAARVARGEIVPEYEAPLEVATLYWHLVDLIWIFLYPLLYLAA
jgi:cytochrome c oxidase subunit 3